jgi:hypothetical protein
MNINDAHYFHGATSSVSAVKTEKITATLGTATKTAGLTVKT